MNPEANSGSHITVQRDYTSGDDANKDDDLTILNQDIMMPILNATKMLGENIQSIQRRILRFNRN